MYALHQVVDAFSRFVCYTAGNLLMGTSRDEKARRRKEGHDDKLLAGSPGRVALPPPSAAVDAVLAWGVLCLAHRCHRLSCHVWRFSPFAKPGARRALAGAGNLVYRMSPQTDGVLA